MMQKKIILLFLLAIGCGTFAPLDNRYAKYDHIYYFHTQLRNLENHGFERGERYQYGIFDHKSASLKLISADGNWEFKKILKLKKTNTDILEVEGYDKFFIYFRDPRGIVFTENIENAKSVKSLIDTGGALEELTSIDACKEHSAKVKKEQEEFTTSPGQE
jgi:hypothetical protein